MLDEMLQSGYGLESGISLFVASHVSKTIVWKAFSPIIINTRRGTEFEGAFLVFFHLIFLLRNQFQALSKALSRQNLPNLTGLMVTCHVLVAYLHAGVAGQLDRQASESAWTRTSLPYQTVL